MVRSNNMFLIIPVDIKIILYNNTIIITGKNGKLVHTIHKSLSIKIIDNKLCFSLNKNYTNYLAILGTTRAILNNMIIGVTIGFSKKLQLVGVGYRLILTNNVVNLFLGFSHSITYTLPKGIVANSPNQTEIELKSADKQLVGQTASNIRRYRSPEHYKGKGIRYFNEFIQIKETKKK